MEELDEGLATAFCLSQEPRRVTEKIVKSPVGNLFADDKGKNEQGQFNGFGQEIDRQILKMKRLPVFDKN